MSCLPRIHDMNWLGGSETVLDLNICTVGICRISNCILTVPRFRADQWGREGEIVKKTRAYRWTILLALGVNPVICRRKGDSGDRLDRLGEEGEGLWASKVDPSLNFCRPSPLRSHFQSAVCRCIANRRAIAIFLRAETSASSHAHDIGFLVSTRPTY